MNIYVLLSLCASLAAIWVGNYVYHLDKKKPLNKIFMLFSLTLSYWAFTEFMYRQASGSDVANFWLKISSLYPFALSFFIHFALVFTEKKRILDNKWTLFLIYAPAAIFSIIGLTTNLMNAGVVKEFWGYTYIPQNSWISLMSYIWNFGLAFLALFLCVGYHHKVTDKKKKQQAKYVSIGFSIPLLAALLTEGVAPVLQIKIPELTTTFTTILGVFVGYAIWKYEMFTINPVTAAENIISTMPDSLFLTDTEGKILKVNQSLLNLLEYEESELIGKSADTLFAEERFRSEILRELLRDGILKGYETKWKTKAGKEVQISFSGSVARSKKGQTVGIVCIVHDITERKLMEQQVRASEEKFRTISSSTKDALMLVNDADRIVFWNPSAEKTFGYTSEEAMYKEIHMLVSPGAREEVRKVIELGLKEFAETGRTAFIRETELTARRKDGAEFPIKLSLSSMLLKGKWHAVALARDITEQKRVREQLKNYSEELEKTVAVRTRELKETHKRLLTAERFAAIGELAGMVGHDLRNPLTGIKNAAYYLKKRDAYTDGDGRGMIEVIEKAIEHANGIINDLLDYSREMHLELAECSPKSLLRDVLSMIQVPSRIKIFDGTRDEPVIKADCDKVERVFANLIKNAIDAMPGTGTLEISSYQKGECVEFVFADSGVGISEKVLAKLFTPLFTTKAQGMGFGLAICKRVVEAHGGIITVASVVGKGTTFTVALPIEPGSEDGGEKTWISTQESLLSTTMKT